MININLRPWRKNKRLRIKKEYTQKLIVFAFSTLAVMIVIFQNYKIEINKQQSRNLYLTNINTELDLKIKEIEELKKERESILNRMTIINSLQGDRKNTIKILDSLNTLTPKGINLTYLNRTEKKFKIEGVSGINDDISEFLANLQSSDFFNEPKLGKINLIIPEKVKTSKTEIIIENADKNKFFITAKEKEQNGIDKND
jgi:type IV pilus assembly protein PilN